MTDKEIDILLNEINSSELYLLKDLDDYIEGLKYRKSINYLKDELKLIRQPFSNAEVLELSPLGNRVIKKGGWIEYQRIESEKENHSDKKDIFDFKVSKFRYHTFWWFFAFALIGFGLSIYNFIDNSLPLEKIKMQEERIEKIESELQK
ncbi:MAG: hypothetical protein RIM83_03105 [Allomuricauda sp.]